MFEPATHTHAPFTFRLIAAPGKTCAEHSECVLNAECIVTNNETRRRACTCKEGYTWDAGNDDTMCSGEFPARSMSTD